jgi:hypothetical protein
MSSFAPVEMTSLSVPFELNVMSRAYGIKR